MRLIALTLLTLFAFTSQAYAKCSKAQICGMLKTMGHFDILNQCPNAGPLLAECKKVSENKLEELNPPQFVENENGTISDSANNLMWSKKGILTRSSLKTATDIAESSSYADLEGWRLPTLAELKTLLHTERVVNASGQKAWIHPLFDDGKGHYYRTSTTCEQVSVIEDRYQKKVCQLGPQGTWQIHFNNGGIFWHYADKEHYYVWLVRNAK